METRTQLVSLWESLTCLTDVLDVMKTYTKTFTNNLQGLTDVPGTLKSLQEALPLFSVTLTGFLMNSAVSNCPQATLAVQKLTAPVFTHNDPKKLNL